MLNKTAKVKILSTVPSEDPQVLLRLLTTNLHSPTIVLLCRFYLPDEKFVNGTNFSH